MWTGRVEPAAGRSCIPAAAPAVLARHGRRSGFLGEVHPLVAGAWDLERTAVFAVDLGKLAALAPGVVAVPRLRLVPAAAPGPRRDAARGGHGGRAARAAVREAAGELLEDAELFDVYTGEQVGEGRRSLALALSFRSLERTLTDEDVAPVRERIVAALARSGGELRG